VYEAKGVDIIRPGLCPTQKLSIMREIPNKYPTEEKGVAAQILLFSQLVSNDITAIVFQFLLAGEHPCAYNPTKRGPTRSVTSLAARTGVAFCQSELSAFEI
jgi:hypothetical protein